MVFVLVSFSIGVLFFWIRLLFFHFTVPVPKVGGEYVEGIIGQPLYLNPLLSQTSEADSSLVQLVYSGLYKSDNVGQTVPDLAEKCDISEDHRIYECYLRRDILWHDNVPFTASDVKFTYDILQDQAYKSPLRREWFGVETEKIDDYKIKFVLSTPYFGFINKLTVGILPKHIWQDISPENFSLADYNQRPIGTGPYLVTDSIKDSAGHVTAYKLSAFEKFYAGRPYISNLNFNFYLDEDNMVAAYNKKEIDGLGNVSLEKSGAIKRERSTRINELTIAHYFAVFFNQSRSLVLANDAVREALQYATDRQEMIDRIFQGKGTQVYSPFLGQMKGYSSVAQDKYRFDIGKAKEVLEAAGWKSDGSEGMRKKGDLELKFSLFTTDSPELVMAANILKDQWAKAGVRVEVNQFPISDIRQNHIRPREYDALLFGQIIGFDPDPYPFWHSSRKDDPGLNLALFKNDAVDKLLEEAREEFDTEKRMEKYRSFQTIVAEKNPAVFLFSPAYIYPMSSEIQGNGVKNIGFSYNRLSNVYEWYTKTRQVRKK